MSRPDHLSDHLSGSGTRLRDKPTRPVKIGNITVGDQNPIAVQSMTATKTQDVEATSAQAEALRRQGAGVVRIAVDSEKDAQALAQQVNYARLPAKTVAQAKAILASVTYDGTPILK